MMGIMNQQQQEPINKTAALEALSPFLNNPRRTIIQVEAFTTVVIMLLLLQLILGSFRRQSARPLVQGGTWVAYTLSFPAIAYTLGLMQSSPVKNVMYPIWAVSLLMAAGCTNAVKVYELGDNKQWKRGLFNVYQYAFYVTLISWLLFPYSLDMKNYFHQYFNGLALLKSPAVVISSLVLIVTVTALMGRELACVLVERGYFFSVGRRVAKFMKKPLPAQTGPDPATDMMKGYKYPVHFVGFGKDGNVITIDQILRCEGRLLSSATDHSKRLKDTCMAFAGYQLLKQRYYGVALTEECLDETRDFLFKGLLQTEDDYERAFNIVEMELGFCHDHFFTKHAIIFELETAFFCLFLVRIVLISTVVSFVVKSTLSVKTISAIIEVHTKRTDDIITVLILGSILLIEILQAASYLASDWCKVSVICRYVTSSCYQHSAFIEKLISYLSRLAIFGYWKHSIGQYCTAYGSSPDLAGHKLQSAKRAIVRSLISCDGLPTNGEGSLRRNGVFGEFSWALQGQSDSEIMLIWNIASEYCHLSHYESELSEPSENVKEAKFNRRVSHSLSRYCAYLMNSVPELLPGNFGDTKLAMDDVEDDFSRALESPSSAYEAIYELQDQEEGYTSIFMRGVKLGKQLEAMPDRAICWKILADFWAEKILYIAPTDNVKGHMELLAKGGELLTHIWVLLTHAGVIKINRERDENTMPRRQPSQENV